MKNKQGPKILIVDIETMPILASVWSIWDQNIPLNMIQKDWSILAWSAKWLNSKEIMYMDQRHCKDINDDTRLLKGIWKLLDEADIVIGQNSNQFDLKKLNARFILKGFKPPSTYKKIDTKLLAKKHFGFTSNRLEYLSDKLNKKYKKLVKRDKFPGFELWKECIIGNMKAWKEMEQYNKYDVLSTEELYTKLIPWDSSLNFSLYSDGTDHVCSCGNKEFQKNGFAYTSSGKFQRYVCTKCGSEHRSKENLFSKDKRKSLRTGTPR